MNRPQPGILNPVSEHCRYLELNRRAGSNPSETLQQLASADLPPTCVIGLGSDLVFQFGRPIDGLHPFPDLSNNNCSVPSTQADLWCAIGASEPGETLHRGRALEALFATDFERVQLIDGFKYKEGRDLTGYVDGTENPEGDAALKAAVVTASGPELDGSSFVAVQKWLHDLDHFESLDALHRDHIIGRRISDNEELDDAPASAHVKRTAQESFDPEAFVVRRSLPWSDATGNGLMFIAYGNTLSAFEVQMRRMIGTDDGIVDGLFQFSRPVSGGYYWCPPVTDGKLNLSALGL